MPQPTDHPAGINSEARRYSKAGHVLDLLRADILSNALAPGQKLTFQFLGQRYEAGLSPLREALCQLVGLGLVKLENQRGFSVAPMSGEDLVFIIAMRRHVETEGLRLSIRNGGESWRRQLRQAISSFDEVGAMAGDLSPIDQPWSDAHRRVHYTYISACGSHALLHLFGQVHDQFVRYRHITLPTHSWMAATARDHDEIAAAAMAGDESTAIARLNAHLNDIAQVVLSNFSA